MASGNLAICLDHYRNFLNDNEHLHFIKKIKNLIETSITVSDPSGGCRSERGVGTLRTIS